MSTNGEFTPKPKDRGNLGRAIKLRTNHYHLTISKPFTVHQYDIDIQKVYRDPSKNDEQDDRTIKNKNIMRQMFLYFVQKILPAGYENQIVYNFSKNMYSLKKLPFDSEMSFNDVKIEGNTFKLDIKKINSVVVDPAKYDDPVSIQILDLIFTQSFNYSHVNINRSFFKEGVDFVKLGFGLELWKGAYASVRPSEVGLTWNIDSANAAFLISQNVLEVCGFWYQCQAPYKDLSARIMADKDGSTKGAKFLETYRGRDIKTETGGFRKKINGFGPDSNYQFEITQGTKVVKSTIKDYVLDKYKIKLVYPNLPCIDLGKGSYLPMELCRTELKNKKKLDDKETADMIKIAAVKAPDRQKYIQTWINTSNIDNDPILKEFNIKVDLRAIELDGRVLEAPDIQYGGAPNPSMAMSRNIGDRGSWDHRNFRLVNGKTIAKWAVLNFSGRVKDDVAYKFALELIRIGKIHGVIMAEPTDYAEDIRRNLNAEDARRLFVNMNTKHPGLELIVAIFDGTTPAYNMVKTCGDITYGILTQGVDSKNVNKLQEQTISNILLKINTKLGGRNWLLSKSNRLFSGLLQDLYNGPVMFFGADVTHPSPGDLKVTESIAAVTGSLDKDGCFYGARLFAQKTPKNQAYEMIHDLNKMAFSLLNEYYRINKVFPKKIVFFRDGVSEGQFPLVLRHEMNKLREACQSINVAYKPAITFVVVQKRHHTRLFPVDQRDKNGRAENVPPGTIVDKTIVTKHLFDFFMCSHVGIQGTSRPCRYFVLHDENNFDMNKIQLLSHYLCHIYSRCPRSVSYPAPAYYAHLAAFRGRDYIRSPKQSSDLITSYEIDLHEKVKNKMFFN